MKQKVIWNVMDKLESEKKELRYFLRKGNKSSATQRALWRGRFEAHEKAITICLKEAEILDCRPAHEKYLK